jgi:predicted nucleic acid-binding protein
VNETTFVLDTSPLAHFARAGELDTLANLLKGFRCVTTKAVAGELRNGITKHPELRLAEDVQWISIVPCDDLPILYLFGQYLNRLGDSERNAGEASVLAWAEHHRAVAYVDDQVACNLGRKRGVRVQRTLHLIVNAVRTGLMTESRAQQLINDLADTDARFPSEARDDLFAWARACDPPLL